MPTSQVTEPSGTAAPSAPEQEAALAPSDLVLGTTWSCGWFRGSPDAPGSVTPEEIRLWQFTAEAIVFQDEDGDADSYSYSLEDGVLDVVDTSNEDQYVSIEGVPDEIRFGESVTLNWTSSIGYYSPVSGEVIVTVIDASSAQLVYPSGYYMDCQTAGAN